MIRSTKVSNKFSNKGKLNDINTFLTEYRRVVRVFVDMLWEREHIPLLLPQQDIKSVLSWLSVRSVQCAGKQASGIVRGARKKSQARMFMINKKNVEGKFKEARKLEAIHNKKKLTKPNVVNIEAELDSRFVKIDINNPTSFDGYITLSSLGNKMKIVLPFKRTTHFNRLSEMGQMKSGIRLSKKGFTFMFDIHIENKTEGNVIGIDVGKTNVLSCSSGFQTGKNKHGHDLNTILTRLARKKKGSKGFKREEAHRKNYINWSVNQLNLSDIKEIKLENIKNLRRGKNTSRTLSHWAYTLIFDKLCGMCEEQGVLVSHVSPTYTSQRCSKCGWTRKRNRLGKQFKCGHCGYTDDSDLNASKNISLNLPPVGRKERLSQINRTGFFWYEIGKEPIVPCVQKTYS